MITWSFSNLIIFMKAFIIIIVTIHLAKSKWTSEDHTQIWLFIRLLPKNPKTTVVKHVFARCRITLFIHWNWCCCAQVNLHKNMVHNHGGVKEPQPQWEALGWSETHRLHPRPAQSTSVNTNPPKSTGMPPRRRKGGINLQWDVQHAPHFTKSLFQATPPVSHNNRPQGGCLVWAWV